MKFSDTQLLGSFIPYLVVAPLLSSGHISIHEWIYVYIQIYIYTISKHKLAFLHILLVLLIPPQSFSAYVCTVPFFLISFLEHLCAISCLRKASSPPTHHACCLFILLISAVTPGNIVVSKDAEINL